MGEFWKSNSCSWLVSLVNCYINNLQQLIGSDSTICQEYPIDKVVSIAWDFDVVLGLQVHNYLKAKDLDFRVGVRNLVIANLGQTFVTATIQYLLFWHC